MELGNGVTVTWLGHAAFQIGTPEGKVVLVDPWLDNPLAPPQARQLGQVDLALVTHGHFDHLGNTIQIARERGCQVLAIFEIATWLKAQGVPEAQAGLGMNKGGTVAVDGLRVTMVEAVHSSGISGEAGIVPGGEAAGFVLRFSNGFCLYHAGDTNVHSDMRLIGELYRPTLALLPIGGHFTMGPVEAAHAARLLGAQAVIPMHYGTFPILAGTPAELRSELAGSGIEVVELQPGQTLR